MNFSKWFTPAQKEAPKADPKAETDARQKELADSNRRSAERVVGAIRTAARCADGMYSEDNRELFRKITENLAARMEGNSTIANTIAEVDVSELDQKIVSVAEILGGRMKDGDVEGTIASYECLNELVSERAMLANLSEAEAQSRLQKINDTADFCANIAKIHEKKHLAQRNIQMLTADLEKEREAYNRMLDRMQAMQEQNPAAYEEALKANPSVPQRKEVREFLDLGQELNDALQGIANQEAHIQNYRAEVASCQQMISQTTVLRQMNNTQLDMESIETSARVFQSYIEGVVSNQEILKEWRLKWKEFSKKLDMIVNDPECIAEKREALQKYEARQALEQQTRLQNEQQENRKQENRNRQRMTN